MKQERQNKQDNNADYNPTDRNFQRPDADNSSLSGDVSNAANNNGEEIEDTDPPLTEEDLKENNLTNEEADNIVWDQPQQQQKSNDQSNL